MQADAQVRRPCRARVRGPVSSGYMPGDHTSCRTVDRGLRGGVERGS